MTVKITTDGATAITATTSSTAKPPSKSAAVIKLLTRARGATVAEIQSATSWQPHSVRAFLSGLRKAGRTLEKEERKSGETSYRFSAAAVAETSGASVAVRSAATDTDVSASSDAGVTATDASVEASA